MPVAETEREGPVGLTLESRTALRPLTRDRVTFDASGFIGSWQQLNGSKTIRHCIDQIEASGAVDNFRRLTGESTADFRGPLFADSDVYKTLEAIAWETGRTGTTEYDAFADEVIALIERAQDADGYINTYVQGGMADERLSSMRWSHELYCLGHLVQAAIAFVRSNGRRDLLEVAIRFADLVERELGPGRRSAIDGHPEIETALVELARLTGEQRFTALARLFIDRRGHNTLGPDYLGPEYFLDDEPIRQATEAVGHAVRQLYLATGATDLVAEEPDVELEQSIDRIWHSAHRRKMYITGGMGSRHRGEAFGDPFELPPDRAYAETCAGIAAFMWNWRMLLRSGDGRFADEMERGLYNVIAASTSISGTTFFYVNRLQLRAEHRSEGNASVDRLPWFTCACCPPNLARLVASLDSYAATRDDRGVQLHLYGSSTIALSNGPDAATATVHTAYPWDGRITVTLDRELDTELRLRIPGWATGYTVKIDGEPSNPSEELGYLVLPPRSVTASVELELNLEPVIERPHPRLDAARGTVAVRRGPIVYALEQADLPDGVEVEEVRLSESTTLSVIDAPPGLDTPAISASGATARATAEQSLYSSAPPSTTDRPIGSITLVPYFRWANRRQAAMRIWIPTR